MAEETYNQREHMESVIREGGSVYHRGQIVTSLHHLPSEASLAKGDSRREAAARESITARRAALDQEEAELDAAYIGTHPAAKSDELPDGFPGRAALVEAGFNSTVDVAQLSEEELTEVPGIGTATAAKIIEARG